MILMTLSWRSRKQITYLSIFILIIVAIIAFFTWYLWPQPTCFDGKQNQGEEGIDCGGPCAEKCFGKVKDLIVLWTRVFKVSEGQYDAAALIENPNLTAGSPVLRYQFRVYDADNILIAIRQGETFLNPQERFVIFEPTIDTGKRIPQRAFIEISDIDWKYIEKKPTSLVVAKKEFQNLPFPTLQIQIKNSSVFPVKDVFIAGVLFDEEGNVIGVSSTKLDRIEAQSTQLASFTWPIPFDKEPANSQVFMRIQP